MAVNRRNFYRILHVQPEAPLPVITASYRAMMSKLRLHPDLGGDTQNAQLINEAYAVLRDPMARAQYDLKLNMRKVGAGPASNSAARSDAGQRCPFCAAHRPREILPNTRCLQCECPLAPAPKAAAGKREMIGRRAVPRMSRDDGVHFLPAWQTPARAARVCDLSMAGIRIVTDLTVAKHQAIRVIGPLFDIVAVVVACRTDGRRVEIHATLRTAMFMRPKGVVVSLRT